MRFAALVAVVCSTTCLTGSASADLLPWDTLEKVRVRAAFGFRVFNDSSALGNLEPGQTSISSAPLLGLRLELPVHRLLHVELELPATVTLSRDDEATLFFMDPRVLARLALPGSNSLRPHAVLGLGAPFVTSTNRNALDSDILPELQFGLGLRLERKDSLSLRFDLRGAALPARGDQLITAELEFLVSVYKTVPGPRPYGPGQRQQASAPSQPTGDLDGDGILDDKDACPERPEDLDKFQDEDGCPEIDNDGDGVLDYADRCATEAESHNGYKDLDGCSDLLPGDLRAVMGQVRGGFGLRRSSLRSGTRRSLRRLALVLQKYPSVLVTLSTYVAENGDEESDFELSHARAEQARDALVGFGVDGTRIKVRAFGGDAEAFRDATGASRTALRVDLIISGP